MSTCSSTEAVPCHRAWHGKVSLTDRSPCKLHHECYCPTVCRPQTMSMKMMMMWYLQDSLNDDSSIADCNINKVSSVHYGDYISTHQSVKKLNYTQNHPRTSWIEHRRQLHTGSGKKAPIHMAQLEQKYHFVLATISTHFFPTQKWRKLLLSEVFFATKKSLKCSCDQGLAPIVHSFIPLAQHTDRPTVA